MGDVVLDEAATADWDSRRSNHHEVLGLGPLLANLDDKAWTETFYRKIAEQQDPENGGFPRKKINISRTYAYTVLHRATGRMPFRAEKIVDSMLALQQPNGFWQGEPGFSTMDAAYILVRLPPVLKHCRQEARQALDRLAVALERFYRENQQRVHQTTHGVLAIVHTFGFLQEAFPDRFPSQRPYRFDWDKPSMYRCDVIGCRNRRVRAASMIHSVAGPRLSFFTFVLPAVGSGGLTGDG